MANAAVATPTILTDPGVLYIAPLGSTLPTNTVTASAFADTWPAAWIPLGATEDGSEFSFSSEVEAVEVAEFFAPIAYRTTSQESSIAFNLASYTLTNYRRAVNGGVAALTPTSGTGATSLYTLEPPAPGSEVRAMIGWESLDSTVRLICHQTIQGGEVTSERRKAPDLAVIPCTFQLETTASGKTWTMHSAGVARG